MLSLVSINKIIWFSSFVLLMWCITLIDLHMMDILVPLELTPFDRDVFIFLMCCRVWFGSICRIFASVFIRDTGL